MMDAKKCLAGGIIILMMLMTAACTNGQSWDKETKQQMVEQVKKLETYEYDLYYFNMDYDEYLTQVKGIVSDEYLNAVSDRIIFGYNEVEYTSKELIGMPRDEWNKHKDHMLGTIKHLGLDEQKITIQVSDPYVNEQENQVIIYTSEMREVQDKPFTKMNKEYTLNLIEDQWLITGVESDRFTFGSDRTEEEIQSNLAKMKYQTHEDQPVTYLEDSLILEGVGGE